MHGSTGCCSTFPAPASAPSAAAPEARWRKSESDLPALAELQRALLRSALAACRPGGVVAYVTCSPVPAETRDVVTAVVSSTPATEILDAPAVLSPPTEILTPPRSSPRPPRSWTPRRSFPAHRDPRRPGGPLPAHRDPRRPGGPLPGPGHPLARPSVRAALAPPPHHGRHLHSPPPPHPLAPTPYQLRGDKSGKSDTRVVTTDRKLPARRPGSSSYHFVAEFGTNRTREGPRVIRSWRPSAARPQRAASPRRYSYVSASICRLRSGSSLYSAAARLASSCSGAGPDDRRGDRLAGEHPGDRQRDEAGPGLVGELAERPDGLERALVPVPLLVHARPSRG